MEVYLDHVRKTIELEAPRITAQRKDYERVVKSHEKLSQRLDELVHEKSQLCGQQKEHESRTVSAESKAEELEQHNKDLCSQIQHLLKKGLERQYGHTLSLYIVM